MAAVTRDSLLDTLAASPLLERVPPEELAAALDGCEDPKAILQAIFRKGWLTRYQIQQIAAGRIHELAVGPYILLDQLGEGGMGQVFKAQQRAIDRLVALKVIRKDHIGNPKVIKRFQREIEATAQLSDLHIVRSFDADQVDKNYFIAMEYIEGWDLSRLVKQLGPLFIGQACDYIRQAALGLQHAHEQNLIHRDIKPANLLVTWAPGQNRIGSHAKPWIRVKDKSRPDLTPGSVIQYSWGLIKILDLGLARWTDEDTERTALTQMGTVMGTPEFIAPEQARNSSKCDTRADIYSLGCTFYFLLTGSPPFPKGTLTEKLLQHQFDDPEPIAKLRTEKFEIRDGEEKTSPARYQTDIPEEVETILRRMMAKRPEARFQTPQEVAEALSDLMNLIHTRKLERLRRNPSIRPPSEYELGRRPDSDPDTSSQSTNTLPPALSTPNETSESLPSFLPRTAAVAPPATLPVQTKFERIKAILPRRMTWQLLAACAGCITVFVLLATVVLARLLHTPSPVSREASTVKESLEEAHWKRLLSKVQGRKHTWEELSQDLRRFRQAYPSSSHGSDLETLRAHLPSEFDGFQRESLDQKKLPAMLPNDLVGVLGGQSREFFHRAVHTLAVSLNGRWVVCNDGSSLKIWDTLDFTMPYVFTEHGTPRVTCATFAPDGKLLATGAEDGSLVLWDPSQRLAFYKSPPGSKAICRLAFSPDSQWLAAAGHDGTIRLWNAKSRSLLGEWDAFGGEILALAFGNDNQTVFWSTDTKVYWANLTANTSNREQYLNLHQGNIRVLRFHPTQNFLICGGEEGRMLLCEWDGKKLEDRAILKDHTAQVHQAYFTPDGTSLFTMGADQLVLQWDLNSRRAVKNWKLKGNVTSFALAPDSRHFLVGTQQGMVLVFRTALPYRPEFTDATKK